MNQKVARTPGNHAEGTERRGTQMKPTELAAAPPETETALASAKARALEAFAEVGVALETATGIDDVLRVIARKARALVAVERCSIYLRDDEAGLFRGRVSEGGSRDLGAYVRRSLAGMEADGMTRELLRTHQPVIIA